MENFHRLGILGASGVVGRQMVCLLENSAWVKSDPVLLVSERSAGLSIPFRGRNLVCEQVCAEHFKNLDLVLFSAGGEASRYWGPIAEKNGAWVVDNSSAFRMDPERLLIVPEINGQLVVAMDENRTTGGLIPNPNCSTIQIAMAVAALEKNVGLEEVHVTTLQAVSGAGQASLEILRRQNKSTADMAEDEKLMAGNVWPAIGPATADGSFEEETKVVHELRKILGRGSDLAITCTATRVPVEVGHCAAVRVVCSRNITVGEAATLLQEQAGLIASPDPHQFKTPVEMAGQPGVHVGRLRQDPGNPRALLMWVVADNLLKGAAWNSLQIAALLAGQDG
jgi:aspartate-semialdehyde dehydrogenase